MISSSKCRKNYYEIEGRQKIGLKQSICFFFILRHILVSWRPPKFLGKSAHKLPKLLYFEKPTSGGCAFRSTCDMDAWNCRPWLEESACPGILAENLISLSSIGSGIASFLSDFEVLIIKYGVNHKVCDYFDFIALMFALFHLGTCSNPARIGMTCRHYYATK